MWAPCDGCSAFNTELKDLITSLSFHDCCFYNLCVQQRSDKTTAFHMVCEQGSMLIVKYLASKDPAVCRITLLDFRGKTPLHLAASKNHVHIVEFLLENVSANG